MTTSGKVVGIIGAGPAGLTAAYELAKKGVAVEVFESSDHVGGMSSSFPLWGQIVDLGPHRFFSSDKQVNRVWNEVIGDDYNMVNRLTRIYYKKKFFDYPLKAFNALLGLGFFQSTLCVLSYLLIKIAPKKDESTFDNWVTNRFGSRLYGIFFKSYSEKLWGIPCRDLDADFAAQRIKKLSLMEAIKAAVFGGGGSKHKTLVDQFAYPFKGTGSFYRKMADLIEANGGKIHLSTPTQSVSLADPQAPEVVLGDGSVRRFDYVVSSMPLTQLVLGLNPPADIVKQVEKLRYRNTILAYLEIENAGLFPDQWVYVHSADLETGRITNFRNWLPSLCGDSPNTIVCMEYWCYDEDAMWTQSDAELGALATDEMKRTGLIGSSRVLNCHIVRVRRSYPVYSTGYKKHLEPVQDYLTQFNKLIPIGRYGAFKYNNQDHSILMGILAAQNILGTGHHDLWRINTDTDYQEAAEVSTSGLQGNQPASAS